MTIALMIIGLVLVILKLASVIAWSWLIVLIPFAVLVFMWAVIIGISVFAVFFHDRQKRKFIKQFKPEQREFAEHLWDYDN